MNTKKCPKCGKDIPAIAKKCEFCGAWQDEEGVKKGMMNREVESSIIDLSKHNFSGTGNTYHKPTPSLKSAVNGESIRTVAQNTNIAKASVENGIDESGNILGNHKNLPPVDVDAIKQKATENIEVGKEKALDFLQAQKNILIGAAAGIVLIVACVIGYNLFMDSRILNRSISEQYTFEEIEKIEKDEPDFGTYYGMIENIRQYIEQDPEFAEITYKRMLVYLKHYTNTDYCYSLASDASQIFEEKYHKPLLAKIEAERNKWTEYIDTHNPENYLKINIGQRYVESYGSYYPGFYFELEYPKGEITDCSVRYGLVNKETEAWCSNADSHGDLEALRERSKDKDYRWNYMYSYSKDIYDTWKMEAVINSVTLPSGEVINRNDVENVPTAAMAYIDNPSSENEFAFVKDCIDPNYPSLQEIIAKTTVENLTKEDALCTKLIELTNQYSIVIPRGWNSADTVNKYAE